MLINSGTNKDDNSRVFKQMINTFYKKMGEPQDNNSDMVAKNTVHNIKIEPKIFYNSFHKALKIEFRIGNEQLYKLKNLPEFYERMLKHENYRYGTKLEFIHIREVFEEDSLSLLDYVLKYAEIIKYANESVNYYGYSGRTMEDSYINVSNSGIDELFEVMKGKYVKFQREYSEEEVYFEDHLPEVKFHIQKLEGDNYKITTNIEVFDYDVMEGKKYIYFLYQRKLHRCSKEFKENVIKMLEIYKNNYISEINFKKDNLFQFFSIVFPKLKENIELEELEKEQIEKYVPKELFVKMYLDFNEENYIISDIRFIYGEKEFNPLINQKIDIARDIARENEVLDMFVKTGFMLDKENARLILVDEENIYNFLCYGIEEYMSKFEILATDNFKHKEIRQSKIGNLGVKIENDLLKINLDNIDFDIAELKEIINKYKLKKKYHRLKDGSFLQLKENSTIEFINTIVTDLDIDYKQIENGEINLPIYRSMYLEKLLENMDNTEVVKDNEYKELIHDVQIKNIDKQLQVPNGLNANLRSYQKIGIKWLRLLDEYKLGGILADDMGLGKTIQILAVILLYIQSTDNPKPSIVICPSSLTLNWENEIKKFAPKLKTLVIRGGTEERFNQIKELENYNIIITSYDLLKRDIQIYQEFAYKFKYVIADEAQYIKNNNTQNAKAIKKINAETRYALTGTPIENSLAELWSIFDFIMPGYLFSYRKFKELYEMPIIRDNSENEIRKLKMLIEPFILRRIKKEVLTELPDKTITVLNNEMQGEQLKIYMSYVASAKKEAIKEISENGFEKSQIKILALLMRLRQICCHPGIFLNDYSGTSSKLTQCIEVIKDAVSGGHKILLFSGYTSMFELLEKEFKKENIKYFKLTGQTKVGDRIKLVDEFNINEDIKVFLISLKAGGTGLNLIGADMVIHYDPWWNLSAENQATDRTYRIGQKRNVQVYKMITKNSIEEKIYELQQRKANLADNMLSTQTTFINQLSKEDIISLFE